MANVKKSEAEINSKKVKKSATSISKTSKKNVVVKKESGKQAIAINALNKQNDIKKSSSTKLAKNKSTSKTKPQNTKKKKSEFLEYYDLPYRYNETIVRLLAQTPKKLFVYWDISDNDKEKLKKDYGENFFEITKPVLIVHNISNNYTFEVQINDFANSWYFDVEDTKCKYYIELGRRFNENLNTYSDKNYPNSEIKNYIYITSSNTVEAPNNHILFDYSQNMVYFRNVKTGKTQSKNVASLSFIRNMGKIYHFYDLYKKIYPNKSLSDITDNPSSPIF